MDVEDEIPAGWRRSQPQQTPPRPRRGPRLPRPLVAFLLLVGYAGCALLFTVAARDANSAIQTRRAYTAAPICAVADERRCGPEDRTHETITVTGSTLTKSTRNEPDSLKLDFTDPSQLDASGFAIFWGGDIPDLNPPNGVGQQLAAELWRHQLVWIADPNGTRDYPQESTQNTIDSAGGIILLPCAACFPFCCFAWWRLVRRGAVSDHAMYRPALALSSLIVGTVGWTAVNHAQTAGIWTVAAALLLAAALGLPPLRLPWRPTVPWRRDSAAD